MSKPAQKRAAHAQTAARHPGAPEENTGLHAIDEARRTDTLLPPRGDSAEFASLEDLGAVLELEPDAVNEQDAPPAVPRGMVSGVFTSKPLAPSASPPPTPLAADPVLLALSDSLQPYYREQERHAAERARLEFEDLSLQPGNPYSASSLVPPPSKPFPTGKVLSVTAGLAVLLASGWFALRANTAQPAATPKARTPAATAPIAVAEPVVAAPEQTAPQTQPAPLAEPEATPAASVAPPTTATPAHEPVAAPREELVTAKPLTVPVSVPVTPGEPTATQPTATTPTETRDTAVAGPAASVALPELLSREQVTAGFQMVREQLAACAAGKHGVAQINATIANSGRVSHALIDGEFKGTPEGSCMARAVRAARFPLFSQPNLKVSYPVAL